MTNKLVKLFGGAILAVSAGSAGAVCPPSAYTLLKAALTAASQSSTGGYGLNMWATLVDNTGLVCAVATNGPTGESAGNSAWLGSRLISAQKANTANAFSLDGYAISTANLYAAVQPNGGSLFGLQESNPVDASLAYLGSPSEYGTANDPLVGHRVGGINVFGGGLAIYGSGGKKLGAIGVSGDTSCRDHAFAWEMRRLADLQAKGAGITTANKTVTGEEISFDGATVGDEALISLDGFNKETNYWTAWAQPACPNSLNELGVGAIGPGTLVVKPPVPPT